jgi:hypothetical protein
VSKNITIRNLIIIQKSSKHYNIYLTPRLIPFYVHSLLQTTRGDFLYIKPEFLTECEKEQKLLDPAPFLFEVNRSRFVQNKKKSMTRLMEQQRGLKLISQAVQRLATTTVRQRIKTRNPKRTREQINECRMKKRRDSSVHRISYRLPTILTQEYFEFRRKFHEDRYCPIGPKLTMARTNAILGRLWREHKRLQRSISLPETPPLSQ